MQFTVFASKEFATIVPSVVYLEEVNATLVIPGVFAFIKLPICSIIITTIAVMLFILEEVYCYKFTLHLLRIQYASVGILHTLHWVYNAMKILLQ